VRNNRFLGNAAWIIGGKVFQMILSLVVGMFTARYLGPENYGTISYIESFVIFFTAVSTLGFNAIIIRELVGDKKAQGEVLGSALIMRFTAGCLSSIIIVLIIALTGEGNKELIYVAFAQSLLIPFQAFDLINFWYQSKLKSKNATIAQISSYTLLITYKVYILVTGKSLIWFAFSSTLDVILAGVMLMVAYRINKGPKLNFSRSISKTLLNNGYHFMFSSIMVVIYAQTDRILIKYFIDAHAVGLYSAALKITAMWSFIPYAIIDSARPVIMSAKEKNEELYEKRLRQLYAGIIWLSIIFALFVTIFADAIISILYGEGYREAKSALTIIVWYSAASFIGTAKNIWLICEGKSKYEKYFTLCGVIWNILANIILIPIYGITGAALASLTTQFITNIFAPLIFPETRKNSLLIFESFILKRVLWNK
jgi:O-antigen/teichoic acid export membrane protein